ncbi:putative bifunctional diguanylate cyclase/phosphodiesterase [Hyphomicrobium sp.]|jgi:diguanylate cyclase (GGDEF)-like protein|uniref:putative bifunctional diguanylate cyclase/phosphodiesterase n=1 Tax=Hyphomicrobium sp. TaxID=82 RepID=UPI0035686408
MRTVKRRVNAVLSKRRSDGSRLSQKPGDHFKSATELKAALEELSKREQELKQLNGWFDVALNNMARGLSMFDSEQRLIVCNKAYQELYELPDALTQRGTSLADLARFHDKRETGKDGPDEIAQQRTWVEHHAEEIGRGKTFSHVQNLKNGRVVLVTIKPLPDGGWVDVQEDITERRRAEQQISWLAHHDPLTEVANRTHFRQALDNALLNLRPTTGFALHWIDLDRFKEVNDTLGHPAGDALLQSVAKRLLASVRESDVVARLGGDEFIVLQAGVEEWNTAEELAQRLLRTIKEAHSILGQIAVTGASIGIALAPQHGRNADELLHAADVALYSAKKNGRNGFAFYEGSQHARSINSSLDLDLCRAVDTGQLELLYQPIVDWKAARVVGFEALTRWHHPELGTISPSEFIPMAEESGAIVEMGGWALRQACGEAVKWPSSMRVAVNLSPVQFERGNVYQAVLNAINESGLDPRRLELEITESVLLRDDADTHDTLLKLRRLGVRMALDDFGTAYASLGYLRSFPFDKIKIDRSFVRDLDSAKRKDCVAIVSAVAALARQMHMRTVAEGIETIDQAETLTGAGCDELQGFYFSPPVSAEAIPALIARCTSQLEERLAPIDLHIPTAAVA